MDIEAGSVVELDIGDVAYGGRGVGRVDGMAVFVPGCLIGERVRATITSRHKRYAEAALVEILKPSEHRQAPTCPLANRCPGCTYQQVDYAEEVRIKQRQLTALLQRLGGQQDAVPIDHHAAPQPQAYRNKIVLHVGPAGELGYYGYDNHTVIDCDRCPLAVEAINAELASRRADQAFMNSLSPRTSVTFRWTEADGVKCWTDDSGGGGQMTESTPLGDIRVPTRGFAQVNPTVAAELMNRTKQWIENEAPEFLIDLYCGVGLFALAAGQAGVPHVLGVEVNGPAIRAAKANASALRLTNVSFIEGDAADLFADAIEKVDADRTVVIVDPPRQGLSPMLCKQLAQHRPNALLYISCAPDTLARDIKRLTADGYKLENGQLLDMFPRTAHFETMAVLKSV